MRAAQVGEMLAFTENSLAKAEEALAKSKDLAQRNIKLQDENARLLETRARTDEGVSQIKSELRLSRKSEAMLRDQFAELHSQIQTNASSVATELADAKQRAAGALLEKQDLATRCEAAEAKIAQSEADLVQLSTVQLEKESMQTEMQESAAESKRLLAMSNQECEGLRLQLQNSQNNAALVEAVVEASRSSIRETEGQLRRAVEESLAAAGVKEENSSLKRDLSVLQGENRELKLCVTEANAKVETMNAMLDSTTASLRLAERSLSVSKDGAKRVTELQNDNDSLMQQLEAAAQQSITASKLAEEHMLLEDQLRDQKHAQDAMEHQCAALRQQLQDKSTAMEQLNRDAMGEVNMLRNRLEHAENMGSEVQTVLDVTNNSLAQAESSLLQSKEQSAVVRSQLQNLQQRLQQAEAEKDRCAAEMQCAFENHQIQTSKLQNNYDALAATGARDRAELQQLRAHIARAPDARVTDSICITSKENLNAGDLPAVTKDLSLMSIRVDSMERISCLQEEGLASHGELVSDHAKRIAVEQLLKRWRDKVLALLVQQKSDTVSHRQTVAAIEAQLNESQEEVRNQGWQHNLPLISHRCAFAGLPFD